MRLTILDTEATGFGADDRVVEIGIRQIDRSGRVLQEFESLVNPQRDIRNTHVHGVSENQVREAPVFSEIAGRVVEILAASDFVCAYNFSPGWALLSNEFSRIGYHLPKTERRCLTRFFARLDSRAPRILGDLLAYHGISVGKSKSAITQVKGAGALLTRYLGCFDWSVRDQSSWPMFDFGSQKQPLVRSKGELNVCKPSALSRLMSRLPLHPQEPHLDSYLLLLDDVFSDARLEDSEALQLYALAFELGMSSKDVAHAHELYLEELLSIARKDGFISEAERKYLRLVSEALDVDFDDEAESLEGLNLFPRDLEGKRVCFLSDLKGLQPGVQSEKTELIQLAESAGMVVDSEVDSELDLMVSNDTFSRSTEARKAREYGIPIVAEDIFRSWVAVGEEREGCEKLLQVSEI